MSLLVSNNHKELKDVNGTLINVGDRIAYFTFTSGIMLTGTVRGFHKRDTQVFILHLRPSMITADLTYRPLHRCPGSSYIWVDRTFVINGKEDIFRDMTPEQVYEMSMKIKLGAELITKSKKKSSN